MRDVTNESHSRSFVVRGTLYYIHGLILSGVNVQSDVFLAAIWKAAKTNSFWFSFDDGQPSSIFFSTCQPSIPILHNTTMEVLLRPRGLVLMVLALTAPCVSAFVSHNNGGHMPFLPIQRETANAVSENSFRHHQGMQLGMWSNDEEIRGSDRFKSCVPYFLPLLDGDQFGYYIYQRIPPLDFLNDITIGPLVNIYHQIPFLGIAFFLLLTLGTRFNTDMDRNVRFNAQQAAMIDVALIVPELISSGFQEDPVPRYIAEPCANFVWYAYVTAVAYSIVSNLRGRKPDQIPVVSPWADLMVGPF